MVFSLEKWSGKVAVVTGASTGIGAAIAEELVKHGIIVAGIARRVELIKENATKLHDQPGKLIAYKADLTIEEEILQAINSINKDLGPISILINNAGTGKQSTLINGDTNIWREIFDLNVIALCIITREIIKIMQTNHINGHIINMNSLCGHIVPNFPNMNVYPGSKHAVTAITETLRLELLRSGSKIKITSLSPGLVETELTTLNNELPPEIKEEVLKLPQIKPKDIADAVVYILSTPENVEVNELLIRPLGEPF